MLRLLKIENLFHCPLLYSLSTYYILYHLPCNPHTHTDKLFGYLYSISSKGYRRESNEKLLIGGRTEKKTSSVNKTNIQPSILNSSWENPISPLALQTDWQTKWQTNLQTKWQTNFATINHVRIGRILNYLHEY